MNGCIQDYMTGAWPHKEKFTLPGHLFSHLSFPECPCCLECDLYSRFCYVEWTNAIRFSDGERLFPSVYLNIQMYVHTCIYKYTFNQI